MLDTQSLREILARIDFIDRSAVPGKLRMAIDGITDRTLISTSVLRAIRTSLDEKGNAFTRLLCKTLDELESKWTQIRDKTDDFLTLSSNLKKVIDQIVAEHATGISHREEGTLRNILAMSINPAIDYYLLTALAFSCEEKREKIKNAGGLLGKKIVCEVCGKKRSQGNGM